METRNSASPTIHCPDPARVATCPLPTRPRSGPHGRRATVAPLIEQHRATLDQALQAIRTREYWSPHPEHPKAYGEGSGLSAAEGKAAFEAAPGPAFASASSQPGTDDWAGGEISPYGIELGVTYPHADADVLLPAMRAGDAAPGATPGPQARAAVCLEILARINARTHEFAHAVMHTSGQAFAMAFQAGGPHAQDRALEAVAYAYAEQPRMPARPRGTSRRASATRCG